MPDPGCWHQDNRLAKAVLLRWHKLSKLCGEKILLKSIHARNGTHQGKAGKEAGEHKEPSPSILWCKQSSSQGKPKKTLRKAIGEVRKGNATSELETSFCWCLFGLSAAREEALFHGAAQ